MPKLSFLLVWLIAIVPFSTASETTPPNMQVANFTLADGVAATLHYPGTVEPLVPFEVKLTTKATGQYTISLDNQSQPIKPGAAVTFELSGAEGTRTLTLKQANKTIGSTKVTLKSRTRFEAGQLTALFEQMRKQTSQHRGTRRWKDKVFRIHESWVRDHIHEMKGYKLWDDDLNSFVDILLDLQHPDGFFYEIVGPGDRGHLNFVTDKHKLIGPDGKMFWIRLEIEADIEYLMVEAAYTIWQATGDIDAMRRRLGHLEKGLRYIMTDPTRWDTEHGAAKRTFTIDTWDFTYGVSDQNRKIEPGMPMGIMHGDNSGLYAACRQLASMYRAAGDKTKSAEWDRQATELRERINKLCFNGRYYTHQIFLQPTETGVREEDILSLSNTYDINRGLPTHEMAVKIIDEYQTRRKLRSATHFAEWFSIDPPYPMFFRYEAGRYINGGITSFVAGELAKAAMNEGREAYGADILSRVATKVAEDGALYFLYTPDGKNQGGGPSGWGAAALVSAMIEGLAGIRDDDVLFNKVTVSPRFMAAGIDKAQVCARYGPSGAYLAMNFDHDAKQQRINLSLAGLATTTNVRILLPADATDAKVSSPESIDSKISTIEQSRYLVFDLPKPLSKGVAGIVVEYRK